MPNQNQISKPRFDSNDHAVLFKNSSEYELMMGLSFEHKIYSQVLHNGHIAVELLLKAIFSKTNSGTHPWGHDIGKIIEQPLPVEPLFNEIKAAGLKKDFELISSAWDMQYRYLGRETSPEDAQLYLAAYKEAIKWTKSRYAN